MDKKKLLEEKFKKARQSDAVIPAFLAPDFILEQHHANDDMTIHHDKYAQDAEFSVLDTLHDNEFVIREKLYNAVEQKDIDVFLQPIVSLPQRHKKFFELYGRLKVKSGLYLPAEEYIKMASNDPILHHFDALLLAQCIETLITQNIKSPSIANHEDMGYFINITPATLRHHGFINTLLDSLSKHKTIAKSLIFEMQYRDFMMLSPGEQKVLNGLAKIGCRFSLDHLAEIPENVQYMKQRNIDFIKVRADILKRSSMTEHGFSDLLSRKHNLDVNNIQIIAEKIEDQKTLLNILDFDIPYGQGFLFGKPDFQGVYARHVQFY